MEQGTWNRLHQDAVYGLPSDVIHKRVKIRPEKQNLTGNKCRDGCVGVRYYEKFYAIQVWPALNMISEVLD